MTYNNRVDAGRRLAEVLAQERFTDPVVLGLTRGGIPVAFEVAHRLAAPLDVMVARKLGAPGHQEYAIGAVAPGSVVFDRDTLAMLRVPVQYLERVIEREQREVESQLRQFRRAHPAVPLRDRTVILVDDGIATGQTMLAAIESARAAGAARVIVATPVAASSTVRRLEQAADSVRCHQVLDDLIAVGMHYDDFTPVSESEVESLLRLRRVEREVGLHPVSSPGF